MRVTKWGITSAVVVGVCLFLGAFVTTFFPRVTPPGLRLDLVWFFVGCGMSLLILLSAAIAWLRLKRHEE